MYHTKVDTYKIYIFAYKNLMLRFLYRLDKKKNNKVN